MKLQAHAHMLGIVTVAWFIFCLAGCPDYYQQYSTTAMVMFDLLILPPILFLIFRRVSKARPGQGLGVSLWWAFYISVPLFIYDLIYCGYYLGHNVTFLAKYWYITVYYVLPWTLFPPMGLLIDKKNKLAI